MSIAEQTLYWTKIAAFGQIAGAVATFSAVVVSLWLARTERRTRVNLSADLGVMSVGYGTLVRIIMVTISNPNMRAVTVTSVGWETGRFRGKLLPAWLRKQYAMQMFVGAAHQFPIRLEPVSSATLHLECSEFVRQNAEKREALFCRRPPWTKKAQPTRILCTAILADGGKSKVKVSAALRSFLSGQG